MKIFVGKVVATKAAKTAVVVVERIIIHPIYKKRFKKLTKYQVQDDIGVKVGDRVRFIESKPYSKLKKWKIYDTA